MLPFTIRYPLFFDQASYDFVITFALAEAGDDVGVIPVTARSIDSGLGTISYSFDPPCTDFDIDSAAGQITVATASPAAVVRNCTVRATAGGETMTTPVTISGCDLGEPATFNSEISDCDFDGASNTSDLDQDADNLIEVSNIEQLNAVRFDLNGDGTPTGTTTETALYRTVYGIMDDGDGCESCTGFELTRSLDFTDADSYQADAVDMSYRSGAGWLPIGPNNANRFSATFDGGRFRILNLFIDRPSGTDNSQNVGLFGLIDLVGVVRFLGVLDVNIEGVRFIGGIAGRNIGTINNCYVTGSLRSEGDSTGIDLVTLGGLVGENAARTGRINHSYSDVILTGEEEMGGLAGISNDNSSISNSWSSGSVTSTGDNIGGLVGFLAGRVDHSYSLSQVSSTGSSLGGLVGQLSVSGDIENSYAVGMTTAASFAGGLVGTLSDVGAIGMNYFADGDGTNGIGRGTCAAAVCIQAMEAGTNADAFIRRQTWLRDNLDETALNWDDEMDADGNPVWGSLNQPGVFPCLMNMPEGAPQCPTPVGTIQSLLP